MPSAQGGVAAGGEVTDVCGIHRLGDGPHVVAALEGSRPGGAAHRYDLGDAEREAHRGLLREHAAQARQVGVTDAAELTPADRHCSAGGPPFAAEHREQGGLAGAVGSDQAQHLAGDDLEADTIQDGYAV